MLEVQQPIKKKHGNMTHFQMPPMEPPKPVKFREDAHEIWASAMKIFDKMQGA